MVDLKAFDPEVHLRLTGTTNTSVLTSIRHLAGRGRLYEVRLLLVPGINDSDAQLRETADWLLSVDPLLRIKVIAFRRHGVRASARAWPEATPQQRDDWCGVLRDAGVQDLVLV
jgi:pyruvate-formate lyase-activating enzyme